MSHHPSGEAINLGELHLAFSISQHLPPWYISSHHQICRWMAPGWSGTKITRITRITGAAEHAN